jgi:hypothetical protein
MWNARFVRIEQLKGNSTQTFDCSDKRILQINITYIPTKKTRNTKFAAVGNFMKYNPNKKFKLVSS